MTTNMSLERTRELTCLAAEAYANHEIRKESEGRWLRHASTIRTPHWHGCVICLTHPRGANRENPLHAPR